MHLQDKLVIGQVGKDDVFVVGHEAPLEHGSARCMGRKRPLHFSDTDMPGPKADSKPPPARGARRGLVICSHFVHICPMTARPPCRLPRPARVLPEPGAGARGGVEPCGRFEATSREAADDGGPGEEVRLLRTEVREERARSAPELERSPDLPFDRSVNPYRGCEHGCIYCFARPTHAWLNLSPGLDFETRLIARPGIGAVLERELRAKGYRVAPVALGTNTDPYQPVEAKARVMREVVEVLAAFRHPLAITTKGTLVERDLDLLAPMAAAGLCGGGRVGHHAGRGAGPADGAAGGRARAAAGGDTAADGGGGAGAGDGGAGHSGADGPRDGGDPDAARDAGAVGASWIMLRLPLEVAGLFRDLAGRGGTGRARPRSWRGCARGARRARLRPGLGAADARRGAVGAADRAALRQGGGTAGAGDDPAAPALRPVRGAAGAGRAVEPFLGPPSRAGLGRADLGRGLGADKFLRRNLQFSSKKIAFSRRPGVRAGRGRCRLSRRRRRRSRPACPGCPPAWARGPGAAFRAARMARRWSGIVPQQPPMMRTPASRASTAYSAISSGVPS